jgi:hypothetical protein
MKAALEFFHHKIAKRHGLRPAIARLDAKKMTHIGTQQLATVLRSCSISSFSTATASTDERALSSPRSINALASHAR